MIKINGTNAFIDIYASKNEISKKQAREEVERFIDTFKTCTEENGGVELTGFIKSEIIDMPEKEYRNPRTNKTVTKPKRKKIKVGARPSFAKMLED